LVYTHKKELGYA